jgi:hypothetical protein
MISQSNFPSKKQCLIFCLFFLLLYLAHIVAFALFLISASVLLLYKVVCKYKVHFKLHIVLLFLIIPLSISAIRLMTGKSFFDIKDVTCKLEEAGKVFTTYYPHDNSFLIPVFILLFVSMIRGYKTIKIEPLPFILLGVLLIVYVFLPTEIGPLVRPHERVFYLILYLAPICLVSKKYVIFEKWAVVVICIISFWQATLYFRSCEDICSPALVQTRNLFRAIPNDKKLLHISLDGPFTRHIDAYYLINNGGYVPSLFSASYMMVRYKNKPVYNPNADRVTDKTLRWFDYILVTGESREFGKWLGKLGFPLVEQTDFAAIYKNAAPE